MDTKPLENVSNKFYQSVKNYVPNTIHIFCETNRETIRDVMSSLEELSKNPKIRSIYDKICKSSLCITNKPPMQISFIFNELIKGITYFQQEGVSNAMPLYHRLTSCGPNRNQTFRQHYNQCKPMMDKKHKKHVKEYITNCYVERLLYDEWYQHQTLYFPTNSSSVPMQDKGHVTWLKNVHEDYKSCFPDVDVSVMIDDFDGLMPTSVSITRCKNNMEVSKERYLRSVIHGDVKQYDELVECYLEAKGTTKFKIQNFDKKERWIRLT